MAAILTLLIITPFVREKYQQFLIYYAFILLIATEVRQILVELTLLKNGKEFFEYYSLVQFLLIVGAATLLTGWQCLASISLFLCFSIYNIVIYWFWAKIPLTYYDLISDGILFLLISIVTFDDKVFSRNSILVLILSVATFYTAPRFM